VRDNTHRSQLYIKAIYPEESQNIIAALSSLEDLIDELFRVIQDKKERIDSLDKFSGEIGNYDLMQKKIVETQSSIRDLESRINSMQNEIQDAKNGLIELEQSPDFERAKQLESEVAFLKEKISDIDHNIQRLFSPLSKVFSRMEKQDKSEICVLSPEHRQILEKITHDPASALEHDLESFFTGVRPRIEAGSLGLKDQMCEKVLQQLDKLHSSKDLSSLREKRNEYSLQLESVTNELNSLSVYRDKEQLVQQISRDEHMLKTTEDDLNTEKKHFETFTEESELMESGLSMEIKGLFEKDIEIEY
jgi:peptidoglycan hydrolase CwlO-like protein